MSLLDYYISVSNIAGSYAFTSKACVQPKPVCIDLTSLWIWYWLSRPAALIELRQSKRSFKRWSNAMEEDSHRLWNILWSFLVWFSNATSSLLRWEKSWYRTRPKSQNAHLLTLKGNNNNNKKKSLPLFLFYGGPYISTCRSASFSPSTLFSTGGRACTSWAAFAACCSSQESEGNL